MTGSPREPDRRSPDRGEPVYDDSGEILGYVVDLTERGFEVETVESDGPGDGSGSTPESTTEHIPGQKFGEGYLMWRCGRCGAMGEVDEGLPERCPDCDGPSEEITIVEED